MKGKLISTVILLLLFSGAWAQTKPKIAVFSGPTATIENSEPLVTSNKARAFRGLPLRTNPDGSPIRFDHLVPQRLAAPVEVFIEQFSAHPLENDVAELYGPPDGYVNSKGEFHRTRQNPDDKPVYQATLKPEDGVYLLPYMAVQADGKPWDGSCAFPGTPFNRCRQTFYPDESRLFEEIDRGIGGRGLGGTGNLLSARAQFDFYRAVPSGGYTKGLSEKERTDVGSGAIPPEILGEDFFPYVPDRKDPRGEDLAKATNTVQKALNSGAYAGAIWLEGSHNVQETTYWLSLLIDTPLPICGNSTMRPHGAIGNEGDSDLVDSVNYILSNAWADKDGKDDIGAVLIKDEQIFSSRDVEKQTARPGGYRATGGYGGILGTPAARVTLFFKPTTRHTWNSAVNLTQLPATVPGVTKKDEKLLQVQTQIKDEAGLLRGDAIPKVTMVKYNRYTKDNALASPDEEVEMLARIEKNLKEKPLAGFVAEGLIGSGRVHEPLEKVIAMATMNGMPVVRVSRGDEGAIVPPDPSGLTIGGSNLSPVKARLLLMAALMKFGSLPPATDPANPTPEEKRAVQEKIKQYQEVFDTH